jgi:hypothetical protein
MKTFYSVSCLKKIVFQISFFIMIIEIKLLFYDKLSYEIFGILSIKQEFNLLNKFFPLT